MSDEFKVITDENNKAYNRWLTEYRDINHYKNKLVRK